MVVQKIIGSLLRYGSDFFDGSAAKGSRQHSGPPESIDFRVGELDLAGCRIKVAGIEVTTSCWLDTDSLMEWTTDDHKTTSMCLRISVDSPEDFQVEHLVTELDFCTIESGAHEEPPSSASDRAGLVKHQVWLPFCPSPSQPYSIETSCMKSSQPPIFLAKRGSCRDRGRPSKAEWIYQNLLGEASHALACGLYGGVGVSHYKQAMILKYSVHGIVRTTYESRLSFPWKTPEAFSSTEFLPPPWKLDRLDRPRSESDVTHRHVESELKKEVAARLAGGRLDQTDVWVIDATGTTQSEGKSPTGNTFGDTTASGAARVVQLSGRIGPFNFQAPQPQPQPQDTPEEQSGFV